MPVNFGEDMDYEGFDAMAPNANFDTAPTIVQSKLNNFDDFDTNSSENPPLDNGPVPF